MTDPRTPSGSFENGGGSFGRDVRLVTGAILILGNTVLIYLDIRTGKSVSWQDVALHIGLQLAALLLMDPKRTLALVGRVTDKLPVIGKK
jgi:hypothetical protein